MVNNREKPGTNAATTDFKTYRTTPNTQERILNDILGSTPFAYDTVRKPEGNAIVPIVEDSDCTFIAIFDRG